MSSLIRWNPLHETNSMREVMDRLFNEALPSPHNGKLSTISPDVDIIEYDDKFIVKAELPGFKPEDIDIQVEGNVLILKGKYQTEGDKQEGEFHVHERRRGNFTRTFALPTHVKANRVNAEFENGILTIMLPKDESTVPQKITIKAITAKINK